MADHFVFHVLPGNEGWDVIKEGRRSRIANCPRHEDAVERARREVVKYPNGLLKVQAADFSVAEEVTAESLASPQPQR